jgi:hypothetical protein
MRIHAYGLRYILALHRPRVNGTNRPNMSAAVFSRRLAGRKRRHFTFGASYGCGSALRLIKDLPMAAEQMPDMMPKVMENLMPHMIGDVVPLVTQPMIDHLKGGSR